MKDLYLTVKEQRKSLEDMKNQILFGFMFGWLLFVLGAVWYFSVSGFYEIICAFLCLIGVTLVFLGFFIPSALKHPYKVFSFFGEKVGNVIFKVILSLIYVLLILPVGLVVKKKRPQFGIYAWDNEFCGQENAFVKTSEYKEKGPDESVAFPKLLNIYRLMGRIINNKWYIIIPATSLMIILGLILFFASANVVSFFIYTIF